MFLIVENVAVSRLTREVKRNYLDNLNQLQVHNYKMLLTWKPHL